MTITVLLFARLRDVLGATSITVAVSPATVAALRDHLRATYPDASSLLARCAIAVNNDYADDSRELHERDEVALIPPVSGGARGATGA